MGAFKDLSGKTFGRWKIIKCTGRDKRGGALWLALCSCGNKRIVASGSLSYGASRSCGCLSAELVSKRRFKDLTDQTIGRLTILKHIGFNRYGNATWLVCCLCKKKKIVRSGDLKTGRTQSCGACVKSAVQLSIYRRIVKPILKDAVQELHLPNRRLRFDIASPSLRLAIEYDGHQHREMWNWDKGDTSKLIDRRRNDRRKTSWCLANGWELIRIPERSYHKDPEKWHRQIRETIERRRKDLRRHD